MELQVALLMKDAEGHSQMVSVDSSRFTIGRSDGNDLVIDDPALSRRHSLIESFDRTVQVTDCGSQNGTFVNGRRIQRTCALKDGDELALGDGHWFTIRIGPAQSLRLSSYARDSHPGTASHEGRNTYAANGGRVHSDLPAPVRESVGKASPLTAPLIAVTCVLLLLAVAAAVVVLSGYNRRKESPEENGEVSTSTERLAETPAPVGTDKPAGMDQIEDDVIQVMRSISTDPAPNLPPPQALAEIREQVERYRSSPSLAALLRTMSARGKEIAGDARNAGLKPELVAWMTLALMDGGQAGQDPMPSCRKVLNDLPRLTSLFGTDNADRALLLVAGYKMGPGTAMSHPLLDKLSAASNPYTDVNVWYLHEQHKLQPEAYEFVIKFLATAAIARDPRSFKVEAQPLTP